MVEVATSPFGFFPKFSTTVENTVENHQEGRFFQQKALFSPTEFVGETRLCLVFMANTADSSKESHELEGVPGAKVPDRLVFR